MIGTLKSLPKTLMIRSWELITVVVMRKGKILRIDYREYIQITLKRNCRWYITRVDFWKTVFSSSYSHCLFLFSTWPPHIKVLLFSLCQYEFWWDLNCVGTEKHAFHVDSDFLQFVVDSLLCDFFLFRQFSCFC